MNEKLRLKNSIKSSHKTIILLQKWDSPLKYIPYEFDIILKPQEKLAQILFFYNINLSP